MISDRNPKAAALPDRHDVSDSIHYDGNTSVSDGSTMLGISGSSIESFFDERSGSSASGEPDLFGSGSGSTSASSSGMDGSSRSGNSRTSISSGSTASGDGSTDVDYTVTALLQSSMEDGGINCSDAGQYECSAGVHPKESSISISVTVTITGEPTTYIL